MEPPTYRPSSDLAETWDERLILSTLSCSSSFSFSVILPLSHSLLFSPSLLYFPLLSFPSSLRAFVHSAKKRSILPNRYIFRTKYLSFSKPITLFLAVHAQRNGSTRNNELFCEQGPRTSLYNKWSNNGSREQTSQEFSHFTTPYTRSEVRPLAHEHLRGMS